MKNTEEDHLYSYRVKDEGSIYRHLTSSVHRCTEDDMVANEASWHRYHRNLHENDSFSRDNDMLNRFAQKFMPH